MSQPESRRGRQIKILVGFQNRGVATIVSLENYGKSKKNKDKASLRKPDCESGIGYAWGRY